MASRANKYEQSYRSRSPLALNMGSLNLIHRYPNTGLLCKGDCLWVAGIDMANDARAGIRGEHALKAQICFFGPVGDDHLSGVLGVSDSYSAAMMDRNPAGTADSINQGVQIDPVGDRV